MCRPIAYGRRRIWLSCRCSFRLAHDAFVLCFVHGRIAASAHLFVLTPIVRMDWIAHVHLWLFFRNLRLGYVHCVDVHFFVRTRAAGSFVLCKARLTSETLQAVVGLREAMTLIAANNLGDGGMRNGGLSLRRWLVNRRAE